MLWKEMLWYHWTECFCFVELGKKEKINERLNFGTKLVEKSES